MSLTDDFRRAWAERAARRAAEDDRYAAIDRDITAAQIARTAGGPKVIDCDCDSCKDAEARALAYLKERDEAARALKEAAAKVRDHMLVASWGLDADSLVGGAL